MYVEQCLLLDIIVFMYFWDTILVHRRALTGRAHVPLVGGRAAGLRFTLKRFVNQSAEELPASSGKMHQCDLQQAG